MRLASEFAMHSENECANVFHTSKQALSARRRHIRFPRKRRARARRRELLGKLPRRRRDRECVFDSRARDKWPRPTVRECRMSPNKEPASVTFTLSLEVV